MNGEHKSNRLLDRGIALERHVYEKRSRYLVLFLTLNYKSEYRDDVTIDDLRRHRDRLLRNIECNTLLKGIEYYIWKIEEGPISGMHCHFLIFYSGNSRADSYIARCIGEYWESVATRGIGAYWSSHSSSEKARIIARGQDLGIGQIDRSDTKGREAIRTIIRYLTQPGQELDDGRPWHGRMFGTSRFD
ncbi:hypothetical protein [Paraburkholderia saeva]|uniref:hypothetical protein n=1 Tax=Paraburkholderia saeva TaxID=2777537 RepID=UPI001E038D31|nr:hypothetical protein [Paraburkholderia saeva]CAG4886660.1 hypothetical protein R70241_00233 [Paraburkholderia saeva]